jgi:hypothetical protein
MIITVQIVPLIMLSPKKCELCKKSKNPNYTYIWDFSQPQKTWDVILNIINRLHNKPSNRHWP